MSDTPLVSVTISTRNRAAYLREAVESVLAQTFADFELIVCDDASSDDTPTVCEAFARSDRRVRVIRHERNVGMVANWNAGLAASRGRFFAKLDDDNRYLPPFLEAAAAELQTCPEAAFAFTDEWFINEAGEREAALTESASRRYGRDALSAGLQKDTPLLAVQQSPGINAALFVRETFAQAGGFRAFGSNSADLDAFLNLASRGCLACYVAQRLSEYRVHNGMGSMDLTGSVTQAKASVAVWEAYTFQGQAENARRAKLAVAYTSLSRALTLHGEIREAREAIKNARTLAPGRLRILAVTGALALPAPLLALLIRRRYPPRRLPAASQNAPTAGTTF